MAGSLEGNKLVAAILTAGIVGMGSAVFAGILDRPHHLEEPVYVVEAAAPAGGGAGSGGAGRGRVRTAIATLLASASADNGAKTAKKCAACHALDFERCQQVGPDLWNVVIRPFALDEGFSYSEALARKKDQTWDYDH